MSSDESWTKSSRALAAALVSLGLLAACGGGSSPAATDPTTSSPASTTGSSSPGPTPDLTPPTADPAATEALPLLVDREGAQAAALAPAVGADSPDLAVLASSTDGISTTITFWAWDGAAFQPEGSLTAEEPLLAEHEGGVAQWRYLTGGPYPDAVVHLQGGSMSGGVHAVVARHEGPAQWRLVPLAGQSGDGVDPAQDVYANDPLFDDSATFVTRARAGGQVVVTYWRYEEGEGKNWFAVTPDPDPAATQG